MLDTVDKHILRVLSQDSRTPMKDLAKSVGLSAPSTSERLRRLQEKGILTRFSIELNAQALGYSIQLLLYLRPIQGQHQALELYLSQLSSLTQLERITGDYPLMARLLLPQLDDIEPTLAPLHALALWRSEIITRTLATHRHSPCLLAKT